MNSAQGKGAPRPATGDIIIDNYYNYIMFRKLKKKPSALRSNSDRSSSANATTTTNISGSGGGARQTSNKKRPRQTRDSSSSSDEDNNDDDDGDDDDATNNTTSDLLQQIRQERNNIDNSKKAKTKPLLNTAGTTKKSSKNNNGRSSSSSSSMMHQYKSSNVQLSAQEMATRTAEYHPTDVTTTNNTDNNTDNTNTDKSKNANLAAIQTSKPHNSFHAGPLRATTFVRTTARFDYQPDICKDYKETGFCGFGDTCIYLHDRGDTKSGWQMEQEYEEKKKREEDKRGREMERFMNSMMGDEVVDTNNSNNSTTAMKKKKNKESGGGFSDDNEDNNRDAKMKSVVDDGIPYACHICRGPFQNPVVTTCGHYFCESCMQGRIRSKSSSLSSNCCPICQKDTHGVLNYPQKLVAKKRRLVGRDGTWEEYLDLAKKK